MEILIVGAGIAGPTLAYWLTHYGHDITLVEHAPALRTGGYIIDFWGAGFDVADRMGLVPELMDRGYVIEQVRLVGDDGRKIGGFDASVFARITSGRYVSLPRSELAAAICGKLSPSVEVLFDETVHAISEEPKGVVVELARSGRRRFDLVIGADGQHSRVRELVFGETAQFEKDLGYRVAACELDGYRPRDENVYMLYNRPGQQVARFSMRGDRTLCLCVWTDAGVEPLPETLPQQKARIRERFADGGWECAAIVEGIERADSLYFDRVSQIRMPRWTRGRVAMLGDAAYAVSLLAGQGSALAMVGATILAGEIHRAAGDHQRAFHEYERRLQPFLHEKQVAAERFASSFAPRTRFGLFLRNKMTNLLELPFVAERVLGNELEDRITIPEYG